MKALEYTIEDVLRSHSARGAVEFLNMAKDGLMTLDRVTEIELRYIRMVSLTPSQLEELWDESILVAYSIPNFSLYEQLMKYIESLFSSFDEIESYQIVYNSLKKNSEQLGATEITSGGKRVPGLLSNWIADYEQFPQHNALGQIQYMNNSVNAKGLNSEDKKILSDLLKIYDKSAEVLAVYNAIDLDENTEINPDVFSIEDYFPDLEEATQAEMDQETIVQPLRDIRTPSPLPVIEQKEFTNSTRSVLPDFENSSKPQPKRGLVFDQPTNIDLNEMKAEEDQVQIKQTQIATKLEELKQRKNQK